VENLLEADLPSVVTAAMQTTAIKATSNAYSTSDAARWLATCALIHARRNSYDTVTGLCLHVDDGSTFVLERIRFST